MSKCQNGTTDYLVPKSHSPEQTNPLDLEIGHLIDGSG